MYFHVINMSFYALFLSLITLNGLKLIDVTHAAHQSEDSNHNSIDELIMENDESQEEAKVYNNKKTLTTLIYLNLFFFLRAYISFHYGSFSLLF